MTRMPPYRCLLFVPGHKPDWVAKAARVHPDAIIVDLEDAVPEAGKTAARDGLPAAVESARQYGMGVVVRPNAWCSAYAPADIAACVNARVDAVLIPKVDNAHELIRMDAVLSYLERRSGIQEGATRVIASLESAAGLVNAAAIAMAPRVDACLVAAAKDGDTARSVRFRWSREGTETLAWRTSTVLACRAAGIHPVVGLWQEVGDVDGLLSFAVANRAIGFGGQIVIHPSHVDPVQQAFSPSAEELSYYRGLIAAVEDAESRGSGAVTYLGEHVDAAHVATARAAVELAKTFPSPTKD